MDELVSRQYKLFSQWAVPKDLKALFKVMVGISTVWASRAVPKDLKALFKVMVGKYALYFLYRLS